MSSIASRNQTTRAGLLGGYRIAIVSEVEEEQIGNDWELSTLSSFKVTRRSHGHWNCLAMVLILRGDYFGFANAAAMIPCVFVR